MCVVVCDLLQWFMCVVVCDLLHRMKYKITHFLTADPKNSICSAKEKTLKKSHIIC